MEGGRRGGGQHPLRRSKRERPVDPRIAWRKKAQEKLSARREAGNQKPPPAPSNEPPGASIDGLATRLQNGTAAEVLPSDARDTLAIGLLDRTHLIVCKKGVKTTDAKRIYDIASDHLQEIVPGGTYEMFPDNQGGLHAEMAIVEFVLDKIGGDKKTVSKQDLRNRLQIMCLGKSVCPDCAGYLNQHGIPHFSLQRAKDDKNQVIRVLESGDPSQGGQWIHPRTRATFKSNTDAKHGPQLESWQKNVRAPDGSVEFRSV